MNGYHSYIKRGAAALLFLVVILKLIFYYKLMGVETGFGISVTVTFLTLALISGLFRRKWIFGILYFLVSVLMVVDVNYFGFFNRSLSVAALGAADLLGGVTESIKELFLPQSLLLLADAAVLLIGLILFAVQKKKGKGWMLRYFGGENPIYETCVSWKARVLCFGLAFLFVSSLILIVPKEDSLGSSVFSQEFFSYHLRDITGINAPGQETDFKDILAIEGNYEEEKNGPDFGCAEGMNLIVIQVEAMQNFVINRTYEGQEITPFLNDLLKQDTFYFNSYYQQTGSGNTSDAEFATNNSLHGSMMSYTYDIFQDNYWRGLPVLLKEQGYSTQAFHAYEGDYWNRENAYPGQGFDTFYQKEDYHITEELGMGLSDAEFFRQSMKIMKQIPQPFYNFMVTLSTHYPFDIAGHLELSKEDKDTVFGDYLQSMSYLDRELEKFFLELEKAGLADHTVVAIYGDHLGMNPRTESVQERMSEYLGWDYGYEDAMNVPLIIHVPESGPGETITTVGGQTDFLPTMAYLMGMEELNTIYFGHNLCTVTDNFVPLRAYMPQGSFVTGDIMFKMSRSGLIADAEVVNIRTHEKESPEEWAERYKQSVQLVSTADYYLEEDILRKVFEEGQTLASLVSGAQEEGYYTPIETQPVIQDAAAGEGVTEGLYCLENFDRLYESGVRAFAVNLIWTIDRRTVVMGQTEDLEQYFTRANRIKSFPDFERAMKYNRREGITAMTGTDFLEWAKAHTDAVFYVSVDSGEVIGGEGEFNATDFGKEVAKSYPDVLDRTVFVVSDVMSLEKFNNQCLYNLLFYAEEPLTEENVLDIADRYEMYGIAMNMEAAEALAEQMDSEENVVYGVTASARDGKRAAEMGLSGIVILSQDML